jgi:hypothetical protein
VIWNYYYHLSPRFLIFCVSGAVQSLAVAEDRDFDSLAWSASGISHFFNLNQGISHFFNWNQEASASSAYIVLSADGIFPTATRSRHWHDPWQNSIWFLPIIMIWKGLNRYWILIHKREKVWNYYQLGYLGIVVCLAYLRIDSYIQWHTYAEPHRPTADKD